MFFVNLYVYLYLHLYFYFYIYMYMYVYVCLCMFMYTRCTNNYEPMSKFVQTHRQQNPFAEKCFGLSRAPIWAENSSDFMHILKLVFEGLPAETNQQTLKFTGSQIPLTEREWWNWDAPQSVWDC